ncbi:transmembrane protein 177 [Neodiprion fabricii]|uniref:transmembrane protein 177 n=1 Tax=Neodiprion fabricii TaxID=2872261 RepID=UPI001ED94B19|nr:transmembrane protein 177 [Neodiprion fabricii]
MNVKFKVVRKINHLAWFATESGRKFSKGCVITFGLGTFAANYLPHSLFLDTYKEVFQMYRKSRPVRVTAKIKKQFNAVLDDLEVPDHIRGLIKPFIVNGFDLIHAGSPNLRSGAIVGVPLSFDYEELKDIDDSTLVLQDKPVDWKSVAGQNLLSSLLLSEEAKKFAIAQKVLRCQSHEIWVNCILPMLCTAFAYAIAQRANVMLDSLYRPPIVRICLYSFVGMFSIATWGALKDFSTIQYDNECDEELCKLGKDYIKGGQEYYGKILERNVALRSLLGDYGAKLYSVSGNQRFFLRQKGMPLVYRKLYFDEQMENLR